MAITCAARSGGTFPYPVSTTAAAFSTGPYDTEPACAPGRGPANVTVPQHGHARPGSAHSVTVRITSTSMTCAHREPAAAAPSRTVRHRRHCAGGPASLVSSGSGSRSRPLPSCPGCPPRVRSVRRSRSDCCRARRACFAPIRSFELGVPESELSIDRRRSSSASRSSSRRLSSRSASSSRRSTAFSASFASTTARSRDSSSRCPAISPDGPGSSGTSPKHAQPALKVQTSRDVGVSLKDS